MNTLTAISERTVTTNFNSYSLPKIIIENILDLATNASSVKNRQPWKFSVVRGDKLQELSELVKKSNKELNIDINSIEDCAAVILIYNKFKNKAKPYTSVEEAMDSMSIGLAIQNMLLVSENFNLGSLWMSDFIYLNEEINNWLENDDFLVSAVVIGFPEGDTSKREKIHFSEITTWHE